MKYEITVLFLGGNLKGLTYTDTRSYPLVVNKVIRKSVSGSPYKVIKCERKDG